MNCRKQKKLFSGWKLILGGLLAVFMLAGTVNMTAYAKVYEGDPDPSVTYQEQDIRVILKNENNQITFTKEHADGYIELSTKEAYVYTSHGWESCSYYRLRYDWFKLNKSTGRYDLLENEDSDEYDYRVSFPNTGTFKCTVYVLGDDGKERIYEKDFFFEVRSDYVPESLEAGKTGQIAAVRTYYKVVAPRSSEYSFAANPGTSMSGAEFYMVLCDENLRYVATNYGTGKHSFNSYMTGGKTYYFYLYASSSALKEFSVDIVLSEEGKKYEETLDTAVKDAEAAKKEVAAAKKEVAAAKKELEDAKAESGPNSPEAIAAKKALEEAKKKLAEAEKQLAKLTAPAKGKVTKLTAGKKKLTVKWNKLKNIKGYELQYAADKKFTKGLTVVKIKAKKKSYTIKKLAGGKKYYVRIRGYRNIKGGVIYGKWSKTAARKTKK